MNPLRFVLNEARDLIFARQAVVGDACESIPSETGDEPFTVAGRHRTSDNPNNNVFPDFHEQLLRAGCRQPDLRHRA